MDKIEEFHGHLDNCQQCREDPFDLCPIGFNLLKQCMSQNELPPEFKKLINDKFWGLI